MSLSLSARSVLITGANRGLGLEFVKQMLGLPTPPNVLIACCRDPKSATDLQGLSQNSSLHIVKLDVTNDDDIEQAYKVTESLVGEHGLNLLINNAGIFENKPDGGRIHLMTRDRMNKHYEINVTSTLGTAPIRYIATSAASVSGAQGASMAGPGQIMVTKKFLPLLRRASDKIQTTNPSLKGLSASKAAIAMIGSVLGSQGRALVSPDESKDNMDYRCAKTALHMSAVLLSRDLTKSGILVMALHPGWVRTRIGGEKAVLSAEESVQGVLKVIGQANELNHGHLTDYNGEVMPY